jgi:hypothetical protein
MTCGKNFIMYNDTVTKVDQVVEVLERIKDKFKQQDLQKVIDYVKL